ncbi:tetratricopeptide repeat protein [Fulvivirgaceae bacterium BMA12]|uniref:Tetratricopeptide repeat protein n=1 Tax=Agaribacillus aureus TaxID=3051825 RepID=A0ABT8L2J1_9BACT|nr:tetratricopeptide repeat protein [Fulvivirgaceae bacterium BMA12]
MKIKPLPVFYYLMIFFLLFSGNCKANVQTDSLWQYVWHLYQSEAYDSALVYAKKLREKGKDHYTEKYQLKAISVIAKVYRKQGKIEESVSTLYDLLEISGKLHDFEEQASAYLDLGRIFYNAYDYDMAVQYLKKASVLYELANKPNNQSIALYHIARSFLKKQQQDTALHFLNKALITNPSEYSLLTSSIYNLLGWVNFEKKNYSEARNHYCRSLEYADANERKYAIAYHNIGETYMSEGKLAEAKQWLEKALQIKKDLQKPTLTLSTLHLLAKIYRREGHVEKAMALLDNGLKSINIHEANDDAMQTLALLTELVADQPKTSLPNSKLTDYLTAYHQQNLALRRMKIQLQESFAKQKVQGIARLNDFKKQASLEKEQALYRIGSIATVVLLILTILFVMKQSILRKNYKKERKMVAYTAERLQESLLINDSLKKSYKDIYKKFKDDDYL